MNWGIWITMGVTAALTWYYNGLLLQSVGLPWRFLLVVVLSVVTWWALFRTFTRWNGGLDLFRSEW
jgi:ribose/xylose/arabinose/galactoside ABC-type transport system permease subunit